MMLTKKLVVLPLAVTAVLLLLTGCQDSCQKQGGEYEITGIIADGKGGGVLMTCVIPENP